MIEEKPILENDYKVFHIAIDHENITRSHELMDMFTYEYVKLMEQLDDNGKVYLCNGKERGKGFQTNTIPQVAFTETLFSPGEDQFENYYRWIDSHLENYEISIDPKRNPLLFVKPRIVISLNSLFAIRAKACLDPNLSAENLAKIEVAIVEKMEFSPNLVITMGGQTRYNLNYKCVNYGQINNKKFAGVWDLGVWTNPRELFHHLLIENLKLSKDQHAEV